MTLSALSFVTLSAHLLIPLSPHCLVPCPLGRSSLVSLALGHIFSQPSSLMLSSSLINSLPVCLFLCHPVYLYTHPFITLSPYLLVPYSLFFVPSSVCPCVRLTLVSIPCFHLFIILVHSIILSIFLSLLHLMIFLNTTFIFFVILMNYKVQAGGGVLNVILRNRINILICFL